MKKKKVQNILITCSNGAGPLYLAKQLRKKYRVFLADGSDGVAGCIGLPFRKIPFGNHPSYVATMKRLIKEWHIDCVVPGADEELLPMASIRDENGILAILPHAEFIDLCLDKKRLMRELAARAISDVSPFDDSASVQFPAVAKPNRGRGSREVHIVKNAEELDGYLKLYGKSFGDILVQPYIEGDEYTVSVILNNRNDLIGIVPKKILLKRGITKAAVTARQTAIERACKKIIAEFNPCGPFNVQLKVWKGKAYIFEINPRLSTTSTLTDKAFGNEVDLYIRFYDAPVLRAPRMKEGIYLFRYDENIFK